MTTQKGYKNSEGYFIVAKKLNNFLDEYRDNLSEQTQNNLEQQVVKYCDLAINILKNNDDINCIDLKYKIEKYLSSL